ncbi:ATP-dependent DNA helicase Hrp3 [Massospora cicadina]|nr:ATP-dependent DNA helicase Hrp3 [Massospora cicadina]
MFEDNYPSDERSDHERINGTEKQQTDTPPSPSPCPSSKLGRDESGPEMESMFPPEEVLSEVESMSCYSPSLPPTEETKSPQQSYDDSDVFTPSASPSEEDDSEYFEPSAKRPKKATVRRKRIIKSESEEVYTDKDDSDDWTPARQAKPKRRVKKSAPAKPRTSGRAQKKTNYNEDYDDEDSQSYSEDFSPVKAQPDAPEGDVIESIHDHRFLPDKDQTFPNNVEFLIKWQNWSHMHSTWETYVFLKDFKGIKKVENYIKNVVGPDLALRSDPNANRDDLEQRNILIEMERNVLVDYTLVERIVARREVTPTEESESGTQYLCKWRRLGYSACTWEPAELLTEKFKEQIDAFLEREKQRVIPSRGNLLSKRPAFKKLGEQPDYLVGGTLRDYQLTGVNWMSYLWSRDENGILADEMGLGKTIQTISFISYLFHSMKVYGPFLVVVPLSTIGAWEREFARWAPDIDTVCYIGDGRSRATIREYEFYVPATKKVKFNVLLTTFELVLKDRAELGSIRWAFLAVDEAHRLKNSESQLHECLKSFHTANRLLITGTPLQNSIRELCALVHFLMPDKFDISDVYDTILTDDSEGQQAKISELHSNLKPYMLRRLKKDVEKSLPKKTELIVRVDLAPLQVHYYKNILTKNFAALNKGVGGGNQLSLLNICAELKKASNHPYLFPNAEDMDASREEQLRGIISNSGKMQLLDQLLARMREAGSRVLIFSQMVRLLDILADYMALKGYPYQRLDGSVGSEARKKSIEHFNAPGSADFVFLLSTRAGGLGINLETADTVIIFDSDWNPQNDLQAMARAHRIGQRKNVNVYRFVSRGTMEEDILERAKRKMVLEYCVISQMDTSGQTILHKDKASKSSNPFSKEELQAILKFGAARMFNDSEARKGSELSLDDILAQAEQHETTEAQTSINGGEEFLKQFEVADYEVGNEMSWEEIIPESQRIRLQQEEESIHAETLLTSRKRRRINYHEDGHRQPRDTLRERDIRAIYRGILKFGSLEERLPNIIEEGQLSHLGSSVVSDTISDLVAEREQPLQPKKAHFVSFKGIDGFNVQQVLQRTRDFALVYRHLRKARPDTFHLPLNPKSVSWSVKWDAYDDAMLLLGIFKHGFGNWTKIRENPALGLTKKMFLSDAETPGFTPRPTHLVRRGEYLLKLFADYVEERRHKKLSDLKPEPASDKLKPRHESPRHQPSTPHSPLTFTESTCIKMLRPVKHELRRLRDESPQMSRDTKVDFIKECLTKIGRLIDSLVEAEIYDPDGLRIALWSSITRFWPGTVSYVKIMEIYKKLGA